MSESTHQHGANPTKEECAHTLARVYEFLDNELDSASSDTIRAHLAACEPCLESFDMEQAVKALIGRCCGGDKAPDHLRVKVMTQITTARIEYRQH